MTIQHNIATVKEKIKMAAQAVGQSENDITLIAVSKKVSITRIKKAMQFGQVIFGENYVQELVEKIPQITDVKWHYIGQLQSNKVKYIFREIEMLHSLDRMSVVKQLDKYLQSENRHLKALVQVNISREPQKGGVMPEDTHAFLEAVSQYKTLDVCGLMCIPSFSNTKDETIHDFAKTKKIFDDMKRVGFNMCCLSMGMSNDYEDAIKQGANFVRVGSAIFGERT